MCEFKPGDEIVAVNDDSQPYELSEEATTAVEPNSVGTEPQSGGVDQ